MIIQRASENLGTPDLLTLLDILALLSSYRSPNKHPWIQNTSRVPPLLQSSHQIDCLRPVPPPLYHTPPSVRHIHHHSVTINGQGWLAQALQPFFGLIHVI